MPQTERNEERIDQFKQWAERHGFADFQVREGRDTTYTAYVQDDAGERDGVSITERNHGGELRAEIFNPTGSLRVFMRAIGLVRVIEGKGEQDSEEIEVQPVSRLKTRGEVSPYGKDGDDCLVLGSFDIDHSRGPDHDVADIEYVVEYTGGEGDDGGE